MNLRIGHAVEHRLVPTMSRFMTPKQLRRIRDLPGPHLTGPPDYPPPWAAASVAPPAELTTVPGIRRDDEAESIAFS